MILEWNILHQVDSLVMYTQKIHCSNHFRSHLRAIIVLDHRRLIRRGKQIRPNFLLSTSLLYKILPTNLGVYKTTFHTFYTSHLRWNSTICHTYLGQNAVFHSFSKQIALRQYSVRKINHGLFVKPYKKFPKSVT